MKRLFDQRPGTLSYAWRAFPVIFVALLLTHAALLSLPYFWDEAGYYIPAAWDFFRTGSLIPISTLTNAHPPLPSVYLALCWKLAGFSPLVTRVAVLLVASLGLLAVGRIAMRLVGVFTVAFWTVLLTALYPVWFAQSTLAHADIFAAACALWGMVYVLPQRQRNAPLAAIWFAAAALSKETSIALPLTLSALAVLECLQLHGSARLRRLQEAFWLAAAVLPLMGWYAYHRAKTGFLFGNPEFLRYNAQANLSPLRFLAAFGHRVLHLTAHMNLFVPVLMAAAALLLAPRPDGDGHDRARIDRVVLRRILALLLAESVFFSLLGGALLTRYLLPMFPLVLLLAITILYRRAPYWHALAGVSAAGFVLGLFVNPPYGFAPEDNLAYARFVRLHQEGIAQLQQRYPDSTVLSAWPMTDELNRPELGYVKQPFDVVSIDDFSSGQVAKAEAEPERYSTALVFSTKYAPVSPVFTLGARSRALDERYFGLHSDLPPEAIAVQLHGTLVWKREEQGMWVALIRFDRQIEAQNLLPALVSLPVSAGE
ncbi:ArnT family glycosyltransferase [Telmatobacter bradus]|uniref:ArnT family glycosyltransferase n=1 Tax=Telmatobacter bradus TaxID=474953 RepID=UPI003B43C9C7